MGGLIGGFSQWGTRVYRNFLKFYTQTLSLNGMAGRETTGKTLDKSRVSNEERRESPNGIRDKN